MKMMMDKVSHILALVSEEKVKEASMKASIYKMSGMDMAEESLLMEIIISATGRMA